MGLPLGLSYIAAVLEQNGYDVKCLDATEEGFKNEIAINNQILHQTEKMMNFPGTTIGNGSQNKSFVPMPSYNNYGQSATTPQQNISTFGAYSNPNPTSNPNPNPNPNQHSQVQSLTGPE